MQGKSRSAVCSGVVSLTGRRLVLRFAGVDPRGHAANLKLVVVNWVGPMISP